MADPVKVSCAAGQWTKAVENKKKGHLYLQINDSSRATSMAPVYVFWQDATSTVNPTIEMAVLMKENHFELIDRGQNSSLFLFPVREDISVIVDATT